MDPDFLRYESFENLYANEELNWGLLCFNQAHQKQEVLNLTINADKVISLVDKGWEKHLGRNKIIMRSPEKVLCDLSEKCANVITDENLLLNYYYYLNEVNLDKFLAKTYRAEKKFEGMKFISLKSPSYVSEVRIAASDSRISDFAQTIADSFLNNNGFRKIKQKKELYSFSDLKPYVKKFYKKLQDRYLKLGYTLYEKPQIPILKFWNRFDNYDLYVFIPKSSIKYSLSFLEQMGPKYGNKLMFWEYHTGNDTNKEMILYNKKVEGKKVLLIDRSFSSYTLVHLGQKIKSAGAKQVDRLALFPKSKAAVLNSEFCYFWNKIFASQEVDLRDNWALKLYKKINGLS